MSETPEKAEEAEENYFLLNAFNFKAGESEAVASTDELLKDEPDKVHSGGATGRASLHLLGARRMLGIILRAGTRERKRIIAELLIN